MKQNLAKREVVVVHHDGPAAKSSEPNALDSQNFARQLRALGQALEKFSFSAFDLELTSGSYLVRGTATSSDHVKFSFSRFVRELLGGSPTQKTVTCAGSQIDLRFSPEEIEQFDLRGKTKRQDSSKLPDPYSISQILRGAGSYLDNREATRLMGVSLKGKWVTVGYETTAGRLEQAQQDLEYFYDYWVKMYLRRSNRVKPPPPSDPTVLVTWQGIQRAHGVTSIG